MTEPDPTSGAGGPGSVATGGTVAIFGGSFNPPHVAHQLAALVVLETEPVSALWMVPTWRHAFGKSLAPFDDRLAMCRLAARALGPRVQVSDIERELGQAGAAPRPSRTHDTLEALRARHPDLGFRLVVGQDILAERDAWHRWDDICRLAPLIVLGRAGTPGAGPLALPGISSTEIRARVGRGESALPLVPRTVMDYIAQRGLYR